MAMMPTERADDVPLPPVVWVNALTGEIKEYQQGGIDDGERWEQRALVTALNLVPDLEDVIDLARTSGMTLEVLVRWRS